MVFQAPRNRRTQELASNTQKFKVRFAKELGQCCIRTLKAEGGEEREED